MSKKIIIGSANFDKNYRLENNKKINIKKINDILSYCYKNNIKTIDTASNYINSEKIIGNFIKRKKNKFEIITKYKLPYKNLSDELNLTALKLHKYPQTILFHNADEFMKIELRKHLIYLKKIRKIKKYGVSVYNKSEIEKILSVDNPDIIQLPINILDKRLLKNNFLNKIKAKGIEIHARSIFLRGLLFYSPIEIIKLFPKIKKEILILDSIAKNYNITIAELSLLWVNNLKQIDRIVLGVTSKNELENNIKLMKKRISNNFFEKINKINITNEKIINPSKWQKKF